MQMGDLIKQMREALQLSQEELGKRLDPQVNKAAVQKWEKGDVVNIKRCHIEQMSKMFNISPCELMCFEPLNHDEHDKICDLVYKCYGKKAYEVVKMFLTLNHAGQEAAFERIQELTMLDKYTCIEVEKKAIL